ncbi:MAG: DHH family phosphoesterase [Candidatus Micrarchaeia archaeon]
MKALVAAVKHSASNSYFALAVESPKIIKLNSKYVLQPGALVEASDNFEVTQILQDKADSSISESIRNSVEKAVSSHLNGVCYAGVEGIEAIVDKLWPSVVEAAKQFLIKIYYSAPIIVRFHNDADGASGAYALYKALESLGHDANVVWLMHKSIAYSESDAENDLLITNDYDSLEKPLLFITDFGTSQESNSGISLVSERFDIIWLDHHPIPKDFAWTRLAHYINPWLFGGDSNFTAGLLTSIFACSFSKINVDEIVQASLIGDYSTFSKPTENSRNLATILDLATSDTHLVSSQKDNLTPEIIDSLLSNEKKKSELIAYAESRISDMLDEAIEGIKIHKAPKGNIYVADFEKIRGESEERYPLPGRFASKLLDKIEELDTTDSVVVLHFGSFISLRSSKGLRDRLNLLTVIERVKEKYGSHIESGGGHLSAASIKLADTVNKKGIIGEIVEEIKKELS